MTFMTKVLTGDGRLRLRRAALLAAIRITLFIFVLTPLFVMTALPPELNIGLISRNPQFISLGTPWAVIMAFPMTFKTTVHLLPFSMAISRFRPSRKVPLLLALTRKLSVYPLPVWTSILFTMFGPGLLTPIPMWLLLVRLKVVVRVGATRTRWLVTTMFLGIARALPGLCRAMFGAFPALLSECIGVPTLTPW